LNQGFGEGEMTRELLHGEMVRINEEAIRMQDEAIRMQEEVLRVQEEEMLRMQQENALDYQNALDQSFNGALDQQNYDHHQNGVINQKYSARQGVLELFLDAQAVNRTDLHGAGQLQTDLNGVQNDLSQIAAEKRTMQRKDHNQMIMRERVMREMVMGQKVMGQKVMGERVKGGSNGSDKSKE
jgi:hypothetical protein